MDKSKELDAMRMLLRGVKHRTIHEALRALYGRSLGSNRLVELGGRIKNESMTSDALQRCRLVLWDDGTWGYG